MHGGDLFWYDPSGNRWLEVGSGTLERDLTYGGTFTFRADFGGAWTP